MSGIKQDPNVSEHPRETPSVRSQSCVSPSVLLSWMPDFFGVEERGDEVGFGCEDEFDGDDETLISDVHDMYSPELLLGIRDLLVAREETCAKNQKEARSVTRGREDACKRTVAEVPTNIVNRAKAEIKSSNEKYRGQKAFHDVYMAHLKWKAEMEVDCGTGFLDTSTILANLEGTTTDFKANVKRMEVQIKASNDKQVDQEVYDGVVVSQHESVLAEPFDDPVEIARVMHKLKCPGEEFTGMEF
jgi:hypothetical protein